MGMAAIMIGSYFIFKNISHEIGRTALFSVLAIGQSFIFVDLWLSHRSPKKHFKAFFSRTFVFVFFLPMVIQGIIVSNPFLAKALHIETVTFVNFIQFVTIASLILIIVTIFKRILRFKDQGS